MSKRKLSDDASLQESRQDHVLWPALLQWISEDAETWNSSLESFLHDVLISFFSDNDFPKSQSIQIEKLPEWLVRPTKVFKQKKVLPAVLRNMVQVAWTEQCQTRDTKCPKKICLDDS